nr:hypothetical protein CFP56_36317 [Quercus suber]
MPAPVTPRRPARAAVPGEVAALDESYQDQIAKLQVENISTAGRLDETLKLCNELLVKSRKNEEDIQRLETGLANTVKDIARKDATITSLRKELQDFHVELKHANETADRLTKQRDAALEAQHAAEDNKDALEVALQAEQERAEDLSRELEPLETLRSSLDQCEDEYEEFKEFIVHHFHIETEDFATEALKGRLRELHQPPSHSRNSSHSSHVGKPYGDLSSARTRQASLQQELERLGNDSDSKKSVEADLDNIPEDDADGEVAVNRELDAMKEKLAAGEIEQRRLEDDNRERRELLQTQLDVAEKVNERLAATNAELAATKVHLAAVKSEQVHQIEEKKDLQEKLAAAEIKQKRLEDEYREKTELLQSQLDVAEKVAETLAAIKAELAATKVRLAAAESAQVHGTGEHEDLKEKLENASATIRRVETDARAAHETHVATEAELSTTKIDLAAIKSEQVQQAAEKQTLQDRLDSANAAIVEVRRGAKTVLDARSAIQQKLSVKESELATTKFNLAASKSVQARQAETIKNFGEQLVKANATIAQAKSDAGSVHETLVATQTDLSASQRSLAAIQGEQVRQTEANKNLKEQLDNSNANADEAKSAAGSAHRELAALKLELEESKSERAQQIEELRELKEHLDEARIATNKSNIVAAADDDGLLIIKKMLAASQLKQQGQHEKIERLEADLGEARAANTDSKTPDLAKDKIQSLEQELAESADKVLALKEQLESAHEDLVILTDKAKQSPLSATELTSTATKAIQNTKAAATDIDLTVLESDPAIEPAMTVEDVTTTSPEAGHQPSSTIVLKIPQNSKLTNLVTTFKAMSWWLIIPLVAILVDLYLAFRSDHDSVRYIPSDPIMFPVNGHTASPGIGHGGPTWMDPVFMKLEEWMGIRRSYLS